MGVAKECNFTRSKKMLYILRIIFILKKRFEFYDKFSLKNIQKDFFTFLKNSEGVSTLQFLLVLESLSVLYNYSKNVCIFIFNWIHPDHILLHQFIIIAPRCTLFESADIPENTKIMLSLIFKQNFRGVFVCRCNFREFGQKPRKVISD